MAYGNPSLAFERDFPSTYGSASWSSHCSSLCGSWTPHILSLPDWHEFSSAIFGPSHYRSNLQRFLSFPFFLISDRLLLTEGNGLLDEVGRDLLASKYKKKPVGLMNLWSKVLQDQMKVFWSFSFCFLQNSDEFFCSSQVLGFRHKRLCQRPGSFMESRFTF